uniref:Small ribosomal subunit protein uS15m n=1 Tax=Cacopsylla melanoneura TaxID=428564 RepID=A0A8D9F4E8_9HEMI
MSYLLKTLSNNALRSGSIVSSNWIKSGVGLGNANACGYKKLIKIQWKRPEPVPFNDPKKSGDQIVELGTLPLDKPTLEFAKCKNLENADENVKKIFSCNNRGRKEAVELIRKDIVDAVRRHEMDETSREVLIAKYTVSIRSLQEHYKATPYDKLHKVFLKELIDKRNKHLRLLRSENYKAFEWLLDELNIVFRPGPSILNKVWRKESLHLLIDKHINDTKTERLTALRNKLNQEKIDFFKKKAQFLEYTLEQETKYGRESTVTDEDVKQAWKNYEELVEKDLHKYEAPNHYHQFA